MRINFDRGTKKQSIKNRAKAILSSASLKGEEKKKFFGARVGMLQKGASEAQASMVAASIIAKARRG